MSNEDALFVLYASGDPHEQVIAAHAQSTALAPVLYAYAGVWIDHVFPRRSDNPARLLDPGWEKFGQHHYTALREVFAAQSSLDSLMATCATAAADDMSSRLLMDAHRHMKDFWTSLGTAVDNLAQCLDAAPCLRLHTRGAKWIQQRYPNLDFAYDRRTQLIHNAAIPLRFEAGMIVMDRSAFDTKETSWDVKVERPVAIEDYHARMWSVIVAELTSLWQRLREWLRQEDKGRPRIDEHMTLKTLRDDEQAGFVRRSDLAAGCMPPSGSGYVKRGPFVLERRS